MTDEKFTKEEQSTKEEIKELAQDNSSSRKFLKKAIDNNPNMSELGIQLDTPPDTSKKDNKKTPENDP